MLNVTCREKGKEKVLLSEMEEHAAVKLKDGRNIRRITMWTM